MDDSISTDWTGLDSIIKNNTGQHNDMTGQDKGNTGQNKNNNGQYKDSIGQLS